MSLLSTVGLPQFLLLVLLSLLLPLSIFVGQDNVRRRRLAILDELQEQGFGVAPGDNAGGGIVPPTIALLRARYADFRMGPAEYAAYALPTALFVLLSAMGFYLLFVAVRMDGFNAPNLLLLGPNARSSDQAAAYQAGTAALISAAFLGAYIWSVGYLILRVANFDLSPLSFLRVSAHILLTIFIAGVLRHVAAAPGAEEGLLVGVLLGVVFLMGLVPGLGLDVLVDRLPGNLRLRRIVPEADRISRDLPLDLIDGVTPAIKFRLAALEVTDTQNLATVNPIALYVESPYSLFEILDWVGQAQLLVAVGPAKFLELRDAGVRDIHGLLVVGATPEGRRALRSTLFGGAADVPDDVLQAHLQGMADALHVQRLESLRAAIATTIAAPASRPEGSGGLEGVKILPLPREGRAAQPS